MKIKLAVNGAAGRMGQRVVALASKDPEFTIEAALESSSHPAIGKDAGELAGVGKLDLPITGELGPHPDVVGFQIGRGVRVDKPFILAPMSGVTDSPFRRTVQAASRGGVGLLVTEFISIEGLTRANMKAAARMAYCAEEEFPLSVQIFGAEDRKSTRLNSSH